jgi:hypothetical protein
MSRSGGVITSGSGWWQFRKGEGERVKGEPA